MDRVATYRPVAGVRWDRVGRLAMLAVLLVLLVLYVRAGISLWGTWQASRANSAKVMVLNAENRRLKAQHAGLQARWPIEAQARLLGMAYRGERSYVVRGLPPN